MRRACRRLALLVTVWLASAAPPLDADVVELTTGQCLEGTVKAATASAVVIDVAGREVHIRPERVRAYLDALGT